MLTFVALVIFIGPFAYAAFAITMAMIWHWRRRLSSSEIHRRLREAARSIPDNADDDTAVTELYIR
jgi:DNA-directed RNA polymerase specialized sigma subunit